MIYTLPIIAALTGWITNLLAVKMLFHPKKPVSILGLRIQGIFPKRQKVLAEKLGVLVSDQLFSIEDVTKLMKDPALMVDTKLLLEEKVDNFMQKFLESKPMLAMFISGEVKDQIKKAIVDELEASLPEIIDGFAKNLQDKVDIKQIVYEKVVALSSDEIEKMLYAIMSKEFRFIEILGGILGFIIGIIQLLLVKFSVI